MSRLVDGASVRCEAVASACTSHSLFCAPPPPSPKSGTVRRMVSPCPPSSLSLLLNTIPFVSRVGHWDAWLANDLEGAQAVIRCACAASEPVLAEELIVKAGFSCGGANEPTGVRLGVRQVFAVLARVTRVLGGTRYSHRLVAGATAAIETP